MPKISILTASYNYQDYIKETIESVIAQTYCDWEMIIVDDGSKDNSVEVIKSYVQKDSRIKLFQHDNAINKGLIETLKLGIEKANGEWLIFLESDDTITPDYIETKLKIAEKYPQLKFIYNDVNLFGEEATIRGFDKYFNKLYKILRKTKFPTNVAKLFWHLNIVPTFSVVMLKKEILANLNFCSIFPQFIDYHLWTQLACKYDFYFIDKKLTNWRMHKNSYVNSVHSDVRIASFRKMMRKNANGGRTPVWARICFVFEYIKLARKKYLRLHFNCGEVFLFGHWLKFPNFIRK